MITQHSYIIAHFAKICESNLNLDFCVSWDEKKWFRSGILRKLSYINAHLNICKSRTIFDYVHLGIQKSPRSGILVITQPSYIIAHFAKAQFAN